MGEPSDGLHGLEEERRGKEGWEEQRKIQVYTNRKRKKLEREASKLAVKPSEGGSICTGVRMSAKLTRES